MEEVGEVEIVRLVPDEWSEVKRIRHRSVSEEPRAFGTTPSEAESITEETWRHRLANDLYLGVRYKGELVGIVGAVLEKQEKVRHIGYVYSMYIAPEVRGKGLGKKLMRQLIEETKRQFPYVIKLRLNATLGNGHAISLYESLGFKRVARLRKELFVDGEYLDEEEMEYFY